MHRPFPVALLLVLAIGLVYGQVVDHEFVDFDDPIYVTANPDLAEGLSLDGLGWALTTTHDYLWHPVTWLSLLLDFEIHGREQAAPYLLTNVAIHAATAVVLLMLLFRWTGRLWPSAIVAGLFALHPMQVEAVAWVSARKEVLGGFFFVCTLAAYTRYVRTRKLRDYLLVAAVFVLCLASKGSHLGLPALLLLLDVWPLERWRRTSTPTAGNAPRVGFGTLVVEKLPLVVLSLASLWLNRTAVARSENVWVTDPPVLERLLLMPVTLLGYLSRAVWPGELAIVYPNALQSGGPPASAASIGIALGIGITVTAALTVLARHRTKAALIGWLWFAGGLLPLLGLLPAGLRSPHDRYAYVPLIGLFIAVVFGSVEALPKTRPLKIAGAAAGAGALLVCGLLAHAQVGHWRNSLALFDHALEVEEANPIVHFSRGVHLARAGRIDEAELALRRAVALHPGHADALSSLGYLLGERGELEEARLHLERAHALRPDWAPISVNLANLWIRSGDFDAGIGLLEAALRKDPDSTLAWYWYGYHLEQAGRREQARHAYERVLQIDPSHPWASMRMAGLGADAAGRE